MSTPEVNYQQKLVAAFGSMRSARECDNHEKALIRSGAMRLHVGGSGSEISSLLSLFACRGDCFHLHWRDRALRLSLGIDVEQLATYFFASESNTASDRNLVCHEYHKSLSIFPTVTPTPSQCLPACGTAMASKEKSSSSVTVCSLGDGATRQGEFLEAAAFSIEKALPILWLVIDNQYAISTPTANRTAFDLELLPNCHCFSVDAHKITDTLKLFESVLTQVRNSSGPKFIRLRVPRLEPHTSHDDETIYRSPEDIRDALSRDPIIHFRQWLLDAKYATEDELRLIEGTVKHDVQKFYGLVAHRWKSPNLDLGKQFRQLGKSATSYSDGIRIADTTRFMLESILSSVPDALLIGEDIEDPLGGVFRLTKGLSTKHPKRVINSPLAEASILGVAFGRATAGHLTIAEIQFMDFLAPGWNQLTSNICSHHWRTNGEWPIKMIIYTVAGAYSPGEGMFHSQVNASLLARNRDLIVAYPSCPSDVERAFFNAADSTKPSFIILPKARLWDRHPANPASKKGYSSTIKLTGDDLTIVTWGNGVAIGERAIEQLPNISIELIDLCYLNPIDIATVLNSVQKTGRVLVVDEDVPECSVGADLISRICTDQGSWQRLLVPPKLLARKGQFMPTSEIGERELLPFPSDVVNGIRELMGVGARD